MSDHDHDSHHIENHPDFKGLKVNSGIEQPPVTNPNRIIKKRRKLSVDDYVEGILAGNRVILSRAVTLIESMPTLFGKIGSIRNYRSSWSREKYIHRSSGKTHNRKRRKIGSAGHRSK